MFNISMVLPYWPHCLLLFVGGGSKVLIISQLHPVIKGTLWHSWTPWTILVIDTKHTQFVRLCWRYLTRGRIWPLSQSSIGTQRWYYCFETEPVSPLLCWLLNNWTAGTICVSPLVWRGLDCDLNPETPACEASTLPLGYRGGYCRWKQRTFWLGSNSHLAGIHRLRIRRADDYATMSL